MDLNTGRQKVCGGVIVRAIANRIERTRGLDHGFMAFDQLRNHVLGGGHTFFFLDRGEFTIGREAGRGIGTQRTDTFGDFINRGGQFGILFLEHGVQGLEHRTRHVPVEVMGFQIKRIAVCQNTAKAVGDCSAV